MKQLKLRARLSAYTKVNAVKCEGCDIPQSTICDINKLFDKPCPDCETSNTSNSNASTYADIDALFKKR